MKSVDGPASLVAASSEKRTLSMLRVVLWICTTIAVLFVGLVFWTNYAATVANVLFEGKEPKRLPDAHYWERSDGKVSAWERDKLRRDLLYKQTSCPWMHARN
jgi:hypothetical protein